MKKILALALALLVVGSSVALTACGDKDKDPNQDPDTENPGTENPDGENPDAENPGTDPEDPDTNPEDPANTDPAEVVFTAVSENVQATVTVDLRVAPALDVDNVIGNLRVNEIVARTGVSTDGVWSRIHMTPTGFEEGEYYVPSNCLTVYDGPLPEDKEPENPGVTDPSTPGTDVPDTTDPSTPGTTTPSTEFVAISPSETVYVITDALNLRSEPTVNASNVVGSAVLATAFERTAKNNEWSRISYMGGEYYVYSEYVTTVNITGSDYVALTTPVQMTVTAAQSLNVRNYPYVSDDSYVERLIVVGGLANGDTVTVVAEAPDKEWVRINWEDGTQAYVRAKFLSGYGGATSGGSTAPSTQTPSTPSTSVAFTPLTPVTMYPASSSVRVFAEPSDLSTIVDTLSMSDPVLVTAVSTDSVWYKVTLSGSTTAYYIQAANLTSGGKS